ncbi:hypothetical protein [Minwuia thermotolerans]|uniref:Uncharacterized protein n=1 Tax=Minwuia thermotolerans TaxID=2056226 RepID=A0A2M9G0P6_9PROT|nr:hypothetical protein [Minwuia thermotolerans]PJK29269.1 hypothetical protein CVT23_12825 [Minwuia thermotolerans]
MQTRQFQRHGLSRLIPLAAAGFASVAVVAAAEAQPIRENFNFRGGNQAVSFAHRQAILDQQLRGVTPDNLLRGSDGRLLEVERGPDGVAIVREQAAPLIPTGGISFGADGFSFGVGGFNAHFAGGGASGAFVVTSPVGGETGDTVNNWVSLVSPGAGAAGGRGAIDTWTRQAASMGASGASPQPR